MYIGINGLLWWIVVGLIAGWLASVATGGGRGLIGDLVLGIVGAFVGGFVFGLLGITGPNGLIGSIVVATIGALIVIFVTRLLGRGRALY